MHGDGSRVTIYDVAQAAGVAISTVSRVLNESAEVSEATRARVQEAIERLRFQPQRAAKSLAKPGTTALAVAMPSATSLFYVELLKGVKDVLRECEIDLLLCNLGSTAPQETLRRFLARGAVDGLLLASLPVDDALATALEKMHAPVVLVGSRSARFDTIHWDDEAGSRAAVAHLVELGHRRIGLVAAHPWSYNAEGRLAGYRAALAAAGLAFDPRLVAAGDTLKHAGYSEEAGAEAFRRLLALPEPPTAVFASSDVQAFGAWSAAREAGLGVPRDLSIVGYDDLKLSRFLGLTTVTQRMQDVGRLATERLLERMQRPAGGRADGPATGPAAERLSTLVPAELAVRGSTGPPPEQ